MHCCQRLAARSIATGECTVVTADHKSIYEGEIQRQNADGRARGNSAQLCTAHPDTQRRPNVTSTWRLYLAIFQIAYGQAQGITTACDVRGTAASGATSDVRSECRLLCAVPSASDTGKNVGPADVRSRRMLSCNRLLSRHVHPQLTASRQADFPLRSRPPDLVQVRIRETESGGDLQ